MTRQSVCVPAQQHSGSSQKRVPVGAAAMGRMRYEHAWACAAGDGDERTACLRRTLQHNKAALVVSSLVGVICCI